jgi:hypothetical protein
LGPCLSPGRPKPITAATTGIIITTTAEISQPVRSGFGVGALFGSALAGPRYYQAAPVYVAPAPVYVSPAPVVWSTKPGRRLVQLLRPALPVLQPADRYYLGYDGGYHFCR